MTIDEYSTNKIGSVWTHDDHRWLVTQRLKVEFSIADLWRYARKQVQSESRKGERERSA